MLIFIASGTRSQCGQSSGILSSPKPYGSATEVINLTLTGFTQDFLLFPYIKTSVIQLENQALLIYFTPEAFTFFYRG